MIARMIISLAPIVVPERIAGLAPDRLGAARYGALISVIPEVLQAVLRRIGQGACRHQNPRQQEQNKRRHVVHLAEVGLGATFRAVTHRSGVTGGLRSR
jgi:hypothetical protein